MPVHLSNRQRSLAVNRARLAGLAQRLLEHLGIGGAELSLTLVSDRAIRTLNREHRGLDEATDVLSFPLHEGAPEAVLGELRETMGANRGAGGASEGVPLGDVVIAMPTALRQAKQLGLEPETELAVLLVHGTLHLAGYDHETGLAGAAAMGEAEQRAMTALGLSTHGLVRRTE
ncbi:MAG: rRNA maturation RNase YbeY [Nitrospirota bacterium]|nr:rRNA maturation RNase YbeY [Nitrospirota bacterium]